MEMAATHVFEGTMRSFRISRRVGGRRTLLALISGATVSLLVLAMMPHPAPNHHSKTLGHRRIHQEENDYTAPKHPTGDSDRNHSRSPKSQLGDDDDQAKDAKSQVDLNSNAVSAVLQMGKQAGGYRMPLLSQFHVRSQDKQEDTGVGHVEEVLIKGPKKPNYSPGNLSNLTLSQVEALAQQVIDIPRSRKDKNELVKAQETALTALQHGFKLTEGQKKLIDKMSPEERKALDQRVSKVRVKQEKAYLQQLRAKNQVKPKPGGGELVISSPQMPVRFPATLKKVHPRNWIAQYQIFLNLTHYPWAKSSGCSNYSITFTLPDSLPMRALASFPSSGNTWIRYLVEGATGLFTGSVYDDTSLTKKGMYGEGIVYDSGMTVLQKSHGYTTGDAMKLTHSERITKNHMEELRYQGVIVIRNPFKALISHRHLDTGGHTGYAPRGHFLGKGWTEFVDLKIMLWKEFYIDWLTSSEPQNIHITYYENVKSDPVKEMERILTYLNMRSHDDDFDRRLQCLGQHTDGLFKRKPSKNVPLDFNPFTQELKDLVYDAVDELDSVLKEKGKEGLPLDMYEFYDRHEAEVSRYVRKRRKESEYI